MNSEKINQLFRELAVTLFHIPPVEWNRIVFYSEVRENVYSQHYVFFPSMDNEPRQPDAVFMEFGLSAEDEKNSRREISDLISEIIEAFKQVEHEPWNVIHVTVEYTGEYYIDLELQDFSSSDSMERREIWEEKYLVDPPLCQ